MACIKKLAHLLCFCGILFSQKAKAQTTAEWLAQDKTQLEYLRQQILALQHYGRLVAKGYRLAEDGLHDISQEKDEERSLHADYFARLWLVSKNLDADSRLVQVSAAEQLAEKKLEQIKRLSEQIVFTQNEKLFLQNAVRKLQEELFVLRQELQLVLKDGNFAFTEKERMERANEIMAAITELLLRSVHLQREAKNLYDLKEKTNLNNKKIRGLYN